VCYDHLAGDLGVLAYESLAARQFVHASGTRVDVTTAGQRFFRDLGIEPDALVRGRRPLCRTCLDWSVRRHHLGGALGAALLERCFALRWARREKGIARRDVHLQAARTRCAARSACLANDSSTLNGEVRRHRPAQREPRCRKERVVLALGSLDAAGGDEHLQIRAQARCAATDRAQRDLARTARRRAGARVRPSRRERCAGSRSQSRRPSRAAPTS
jgi:hypothetical protein